MGPLALIGGNEFRRESEAVDRALLALAGGPGVAVGILPTAATNENPEVVGENGLRHFARLGAAAETLLVVDEDSAYDPALAAAIQRCDLLYISGGDPAYLLDTLRGSPAWQAVLTLHRRGGLVAGAGAGAMLLGEELWRFDGWAPGLGLAPGLAVVPHHATLSKRWAIGHLLTTLPPGVTLIGVDDSTALLLPEAVVVGAGEVTLYRRDGPVTYAAGARVPLKSLLK